MSANQRNTIIGAVAFSVIIAGVATLAGRPAGAKPGASAALKEAKLNIEHNATDHDTGFQGAVDSEGWQSLELSGPKGLVLHFEGKGKLGELGLTELFFETVEPENAKVPIDKLLADIPEGHYTFAGRGMTHGEPTGEITGAAWLTHTIPAGPALVLPAGGATVPLEDLVIRWNPVTKSLRGGPVNIIAYQLIVERDTQPHPHMIGKWGLSMYLPASTTSMTVPKLFLEPNTGYLWEVLAIEESGNQTLSSSKFRTR